MHLITALLLPVLAAATPVYPGLQPRSGPPVSQIKIVNASSSGNGCPQGSVSQSLSSDGTVVTFGFDSFQTYIGPQTKPADHTKQCQLHLSLQYPGGFQYSVVEATYHGWAQLDPGVTGTFVSTYFFSQAAAQTSTTRSEISGSQWVSGDVYTKDDQVESTAVIWSPCGATGILNVNNRIALTSTKASASGSLSDDDATVAFTHQLHVAWQACTPKGGSTGGDFTIGTGSTLVTADGQ